jgi:hypothetical protein
VVQILGSIRKCGRPRKYAPDGTLNTALSPMPISSSILLIEDNSAWKPGRQHNYEYESIGKKNKKDQF